MSAEVKFVKVYHGNGEEFVLPQETIRDLEEKGVTVNNYNPDIESRYQPEVAEAIEALDEKKRRKFNFILVPDFLLKYIDFENDGEYILERFKIDFGSAFADLLKPVLLEEKCFEQVSEAVERVQKYKWLFDHRRSVFHDLAGSRSDSEPVEPQLEHLKIAFAMFPYKGTLDYYGFLAPRTPSDSEVSDDD